MNVLGYNVPATIHRPSKPSADLQAEHVRTRFCDYDRIGLITRWWGVCVCGWTGAYHDNAGAVERDLHQHLVDMQEKK